MLNKFAVPGIFTLLLVEYNDLIEVIDVSWKKIKVII